MLGPLQAQVLWQRVFTERCLEVVRPRGNRRQKGEFLVAGHPIAFDLSSHETDEVREGLLRREYSNISLMPRSVISHYSVDLQLLDESVQGNQRLLPQLPLDHVDRRAPRIRDRAFRVAFEGLFPRSATIRRVWAGVRQHAGLLDGFTAGAKEQSTDRETRRRQDVVVTTHPVGVRLVAEHRQVVRDLVHQDCSSPFETPGTSDSLLQVVGERFFLETTHAAAHGQLLDEPLGRCLSLVRYPPQWAIVIPAGSCHHKVRGRAHHVGLAGKEDDDVSLLLGTHAWRLKGNLVDDLVEATVERIEQRPLSHSTLFFGLQ